MSLNGARAAKRGHTLESRRAQRRRARPILMALEDRRLLSTFTVTNIADSGPGSLRCEIGLANSAGGANTIDFDSAVFGTAQTIALTGGSLELMNTSGPETITGPALGVTISGSGLSRVFQIDANVAASISGLTITAGSVNGAGAGLSNDHGTVKLTNCIISGNTATNGGGLFTTDYGSTTLASCIISGNSAASGGGLYTSNYGSTTLANCTVSGNSAASGGGLSNVFGATTLTNSTIDGNSAGLGGGFYSFVGTVTLTNCTVSGNAANNGGAGFDFLCTAALDACSVSGNFAAGSGGGLYSNGSTTTLTSDTFRNNSASVNGGGLYSNSGTTTLTDGALCGNSAGTSGGGVDNVSSTITLCGVTVSGNSAGNGGGLAGFGGTTTLTDSTVSGNSAGHGGGVYDYNGTSTLTDLLISGNVAENGGGLSTYGGTTTLADCTVSGNSAIHAGGGVLNEGGTTTLTDSTVSGNLATCGAGVSTYVVGSTTLTNCTVSGNSASANGGGLDTTTGGTTTLTNVTVSGNSAGILGGGLNNHGGTVILGNTIVAANTAASGGGPDAFGSFVSMGYNLIGETDSSTGWIGSDVTGTSAQPLNPLLAPLGSYGGPTQTMALLPGSSAIDAGNNSLIPADVTTDQRGRPRVVNSVADIGAFESGGFLITVSSGSGQSTAVFTEFSAPLIATVTANNLGEPVAGGLVAFTRPDSGAFATLNASPVPISAAGAASVTAAANGTGGNFTVTAGARGIWNTASFSLTNKWVPTFSVNSQTIVYGTSTTVLAGHLGSGTAYPTGSIVSITLNSATDFHGRLVAATSQPRSIRRASVSRAAPTPSPTLSREIPSSLPPLTRARQ